MAILLDDRAVLCVSGPDARAFLQNLVTCDVDALGDGESAFGALLSPQGKILFDFFILRADAGTFFVDAPRASSADLAKRLSMYKLRAKIAIGATQRTVVALLDDGESVDGLVFVDPRDARLGRRAIVETTDAAPDAARYDARRIAVAAPAGGLDFAYGDAFPHDANMDRLNGVSFTKGCYVGQEVVSRMQHRGTARRRIVTAAFDGPAPPPGSPIVAGETALGALGSTAGDRGLASIRVDRLADALAAGQGATAAGAPVRLDASPFLTPA